jgi:hypothetical protein
LLGAYKNNHGGNYPYFNSLRGDFDLVKAYMMNFQQGLKKKKNPKMSFRSATIHTSKVYEWGDFDPTRTFESIEDEFPTRLLETKYPKKRIRSATIPISKTGLKGSEPGSWSPGAH